MAGRDTFRRDWGPKGFPPWLAWTLIGMLLGLIVGLLIGH